MAFRSLSIREHTSAVALFASAAALLAMQPGSGSAGAAPFVGAGNAEIVQNTKQKDVLKVAEGTERMQRVIVTFANIVGGPAAATEIRAVQERAIALLEKSGEKFEINRRYDMLPQLALTVTARGADLLRASPDVGSVREDGTSRTF